ncbi:MAG TPA: hypothetical protein VIU11_11730 [Nakamurella sp.]
MALAAKLRRAPVRLATGAYIVNSGVNKLAADDGTAAFLQGTAANAFPALKRIEPRLFSKMLAVGEIAVGAALLLPVVPAGLAGLALIGFGGVLTAVYVRNPAWHDRYLRPTAEGTGPAKDLWLVGAGVGLLVDAALAESPITATE